MDKNIFDLAKEEDYVDPAESLALEESEALRYTESEGAELIDLDAKPLTKAQEVRNELAIKQLEAQSEKLTAKKALTERVLNLQAEKLAFRKEKQAQDLAMQEKRLEAKEKNANRLLALQLQIATKFAKKD